VELLQQTFADSHYRFIIDLEEKYDLEDALRAPWCFSLPAITSLPYMYDELGADRWLRSQ